jgi:hypothetical protein
MGGLGGGAVLLQIDEVMGMGISIGEGANTRVTRNDV